MAYLVAQGDGPGLIALLEPADEAQAKRILGAWKAYLRELQESLDEARYVFLRDGLSELQGRPLPICMRRCADNLARNAPAEALRIADPLAQEFPRRPSAWYLRAEACASMTATSKRRAPSSLAKRTPPDDPVGMGARVGLAGNFHKPGEKPKARAMMENIRAVAGGPKLAEGSRCISMLAAWERRRGLARRVSSGNGGQCRNGACR